MKKLLLVFLTLTVGIFAKAQADCDPQDAENFNQAFNPDVETNFNEGCVGEPYEQLIYFKVPTDTVVTVEQLGGQELEVDITHIQLDSITGLPEGLFVETNPEDGVFLGGSLGCGVISGTTTQEGTHEITIHVTAKVVALSFMTIDEPSSFEGYTIVINNCSEESGLEELESGKYFSVHPNPANSEITITHFEKDGSSKEISIFNIEGKLMKTELTYEDVTKVSVADFDSGIYFVKVIQNGTVGISKLIIE